MKTTQILFLLILLPVIGLSQIEIKDPELKPRKEPVMENDKVVIRQINQYLISCQDGGYLNRAVKHHTSVSTSINDSDLWQFRNTELSRPAGALEYGKIYNILNLECGNFLKAVTFDDWGQIRVYTHHEDFQEVDNDYYWQLSKGLEDTGSGPVYYGDELYVRNYHIPSKEYLFLDQYNSRLDLYNSSTSKWSEKWTIEKKGPKLTDSPVYIKISDKPLYAHASGGSDLGALETLHPCPKANDHPNCQWIFEPAPGKRKGVYYIKSKGGYYLHAYGGSNSMAEMTLHPCPKDMDHPNCQWTLELSPYKENAYYIKSLGGDLYLHSKYGSASGNTLTLHPCPKNLDHPNCQWYIEK